ncbi:hypothetical protein DTO271G3_3333 [Paecilomyces variotii]|nr:hypothetical protein DTO271G3_3333 [Paecilomyces variotii]
MSSNHASQARSLYRALLRELPPRPLSKPSPLQSRLRALFHPSAAPQESDAALQQLEEADQFIQYARAQRTYATLLDRYNPGMNMDQEERVRLTARRVGLDLPPENQENEK